MSDTARAAREFTRLMEIMATLRGPDGCPWDREQTIDTLKPFVLEETYEVLEAIDRHDHNALCEELGDFVFEAVFLAQLESEAGRFSIEDSLKGAADAVDHVRAEEEMGDLLFAIANLARKLQIEPETALRKANDKFTRRFTQMELTIAASERPMQKMTLEELEAEWQHVKSRQHA